METVILKLGGSVITGKSRDRPQVEGKALRRLAGEVSQALKKRPLRLFIVHGAGPYGHVPAKKYALLSGLKTKRQVEGMAMTHQCMERLNFEVVAALVDKKVNALAYQPSAGGLLDGGRLVSFPLASVKRLLDMGIVPVSYGDVLPDRRLGLGILSGDRLVPYLAGGLSADRVVIVTSYNGIYDRDPREKGARKLGLINAGVLSALSARATEGTDVTGGIAGKVAELLRLSGRGIPSEIIGPNPGYLRRTLLGESGLGTRVA